MDISYIIIGGIIILLALILSVVIFVKIKIALATRKLYRCFLPGIREMNRKLLQESYQEENLPED